MGKEREAYFENPPVDGISYGTDSFGNLVHAHCPVMLDRWLWLKFNGKEAQPMSVAHQAKCVQLHAAHMASHHSTGVPA